MKRFLIYGLMTCLMAVNGYGQQNPFGNALVPDMIADASIEEIDGTFYCYATTDGYGRGLDTSGPPVVWISKDFVNWSFDGTYFPQAYNEKYWAPSKAVAYNGKYYIYPTVNGFMYPAKADSPTGPFSLIKGNTFTIENRLWEREDVHAIDTEIFIDDDGTPYAFWGRRNVARLKPDMATIDTIYPSIRTRRTEYSEGPIVFKRKGIYYYLYTIGGSESYEYYYQMSSVSPLERNGRLLPRLSGVRTLEYEPPDLCEQDGIQQRRNHPSGQCGLERCGLPA